MRAELRGAREGLERWASMRLGLLGAMARTVDLSLDLAKLALGAVDDGALVRLAEAKQLCAQQMRRHHDGRHQAEPHKAVRAHACEAVLARPCAVTCDRGSIVHHGRDFSLARRKPVACV